MSDKISAIGTIASQPSSGSFTITADNNVAYPFFAFDVTLTAAQIAVTDAAASGSYGALKLFDFNEGVIAFLGVRQDYTAFAEGSALTGAAGDASFDIGLGSVAIASAADGALAGTDDNIGTEVNITLSGGTGTGTGVNGNAIIDGSSTALDLALNWSGTAATIDATSTIDVTGTLSIRGCFVGDD